MANRNVLLFLLLTWLSTSACAYEDITNDQLKAMLANDEKVLVLDVRELHETPKSIAGALQLPWTSKVLQTRYREIPTDIAVAVICQSSGRSPAAAAFLEGVPDRKFLKVYNVRPGMGSWGNWVKPVSLNRPEAIRPGRSGESAGPVLFTLLGRHLAARNPKEAAAGNRQDSWPAPVLVTDW